jgi:glycogen operon protein
MHVGGPKDLAWIGPDGHEVSEDAWHDGGARTLGMYLAGELHGTDHEGRRRRDSSFLVILHAGEQPIDFILPGAPYATSYRRAVDTSTGQAVIDGPPVPAASAVNVPARTLLVFEALSA